MFNFLMLINLDNKFNKIKYTKVDFSELIITFLLLNFLNFHTNKKLIMLKIQKL